MQFISALRTTSTAFSIAKDTCGLTCHWDIIVYHMSALQFMLTYFQLVHNGQKKMAWVLLCWLWPCSCTHVAKLQFVSSLKYCTEKGDQGTLPVWRDASVARSLLPAECKWSQLQNTLAPSAQQTRLCSEELHGASGTEREPWGMMYLELKVYCTCASCYIF